MHEWVETLRHKLREMKILSPKENLYSKLPEIRAPLLPTRDPTSPLPAPPPVPAAIVPGIERINSATTSTNRSGGTQLLSSSSEISDSTVTGTVTASTNTTTTSSNMQIVSTSSTNNTTSSSIPTSAMSNTLTQNLINMLSNPVFTYSHQVTNRNYQSDSSSTDDSFFFDDNDENVLPSGSGVSVVQERNIAAAAATSDTSALVESAATIKLKKDESNLTSLAKIFADNVLADPNTCPSTSGSGGREQGADTYSSTTETETSSESMPSPVFQTEPIFIPRYLHIFVYFFSTISFFLRKWFFPTTTGAHFGLR